MIPLIKSTFYHEKETKKVLCDFISHAPHLSFGSACMEFEEKFALWQGRKECIMVNSGSSANLAMIQALLNLGKIKKGDNIAFSAITWSTNVMPLLQLGLNPIPVDVELDTLNISSQTFLAALKKFPIKVLFLTNLLGFCSDALEIVKECKKRNILLIEDNCESMGTVYKGKKLGNLGLAASFSFYVGHHMSTIEGGAVVTDDPKLARMLRLVRAHGWDRNLSFSDQQKIRKKYKVNSTFYSRYTFYDLGYNFRPNEIAGFLGVKQLAFADEIVSIREKNFIRIAKAIFSRNDKYFPLRYDHLDVVSNFAVPVICKTQEIRDELVKKCDGRVEIRPVVGGDMTRQPFFKKYAKKIPPFMKGSNAGFIHGHGLYFGNNPELTKQEIDEIITIFSE